MYFTVENCTPEQLDELRWAWWFDDERTSDELEPYGHPENVPDWVLFQEYARVLFTEDDFWCTHDK